MKVHLGVDVESGIVHQVFRLLPEVDVHSILEKAVHKSGKEFYL